MMRDIKVVIAAMIAVVIGVCINVFWKTPPPETPDSVVKQYISIQQAAINEGKTTDKDLIWVVKHYTSEYYGKAAAERVKATLGIQQRYQETNSDIRQNIGDISVLRQTENEATVFAEIVSDILVDGEWVTHRGAILFLLKKQDGFWKIEHIGG